jgi:hypothetical protein
MPHSSDVALLSPVVKVLVNLMDLCASLVFFTLFYFRLPSRFPVQGGLLLEASGFRQVPSFVSLFLTLFQLLSSFPCIGWAFEPLCVCSIRHLPDIP